MRIIVTGALGHIGSRLIRSLPDTFPGSEITLVDSLATQRYSSLFDLPGHGRYRFIEADVMKDDLAALVDGAHAVVHLAAITNAAESFAIQEEVERVNFHGSELMARACLRAGAGMVFLSTTSVYGTQSGMVDEECPRDELRPQSPYAASKLRAEEMLTALGHQGLRYVTLRFGTIAGASVGMRFHTAVNRFCWQALMGLPLTVWRAAADQRRPYLDLSDGVRAIEFVLTRGLDRGLYNVLTTNATVNEIVALVREAVPDLRVEEVDSPVMNQLSYEVDDRRFRSLGFEVRGDLRTAIRETIALLRGASTAVQPAPAIARLP
jgi:nucleoside-diphosphate-sugar epimerase